MGCRGGRGRSPKGQASLPREQEAEPRPADLLLEVRGLGRPSRPHFLQPRPTPCGPRVYGNSGLDGFSEIIFSLCPRLTPPAPKGTQAGRPERGGEGTEPFPGGPWPRSDPFPEISFLNVALPVQDPGSAFHLQNLFLRAGSYCGRYFTEEKPEAGKAHVTLPTPQGKRDLQPNLQPWLSPRKALRGGRTSLPPAPRRWIQFRRGEDRRSPLLAWPRFVSRQRRVRLWGLCNFSQPYGLSASAPNPLQSSQIVLSSEWLFQLWGP